MQTTSLGNTILRQSPCCCCAQGVELFCQRGAYDPKGETVQLHFANGVVPAPDVIDTLLAPPEDPDAGTWIGEDGQSV